MSLQILGFPNHSPTSCRTAIVMQATNQNIVQVHYPGVSPGAHPADRKAQGLWVRDGKARSCKKRH